MNQDVAMHQLRPMGMPKAPTSLICMVPVLYHRHGEDGLFAEAMGSWACDVDTGHSVLSHLGLRREPQALSVPETIEILLGGHHTSYPLWVVTDRLADLIGTTGLIDHLGARNWHSPWWVDRGETGIFRARGPNRRQLVILSSRSWFPVDPLTWGQAQGLPWLTGNYEELLPSARAEIMCKTIRALTHWWWRLVPELDIGTVPRLTLASQAYESWRADCEQYQITVFRSKQHANHIRNAYFGGRSQTPLVGIREGVPMTMLDIRSSYPSILASEKMPTRFIGWVPRVRPDTLLEHLKDTGQCAIASVQLIHQEPAYPSRDASGLIWPDWPFQAYLCTASLLYALESGHVSAVHSCMLWEAEIVAKDWVERLWAERIAAQDQGDWARAQAVKLLLNSLAGKLGATTDTVVWADEDPFKDCYRHPTTVLLNDMTGVEENLTLGQLSSRGRITGIEQSLLGEWSLSVPGDETKSSVPAIAAHVTDYGRMRLWGALREIPEGHWHYCDTDGLIADTEFLAHLIPCQIGDELGDWRIVAESDHLEVRGYKDFDFGDITRRAGIPDSAVLSHDDTWMWSTYPRLSTLIESGHTKAMPVTHRAVRRKST